MFQPKLWAQDRQVKSLPQAREIGNFQTSFGDGFNFSKMRAGTNVPAQTLEARRQSEVPVMGYENLTVPDKSRRRCLFFVKVAVMTNVPAQALRSRRKSEVLAMGCGSRTFPDKLLHRSCFFRNGCGDKWCRPNFGDKMAKWGPCQGLWKFNISWQAPRPVFIFWEMGVGTYAPAQTLDPRRESEVHVMGEENLTFPDNFRHRRLFFQKWRWGQISSPKHWTQDGKVRPLPWARKVWHFHTNCIQETWTGFPITSHTVDSHAFEQTYFKSEF